MNKSQPQHRLNNHKVADHCAFCREQFAHGSMVVRAADGRAVHPLCFVLERDNGQPVKNNSR